MFHRFRRPKGIPDYTVEVVLMPVLIPVQPPPRPADPWEDLPDDCDWATAVAIARRRARRG